MTELETYLARFERPVLALEDISQQFCPLVDGRHGEIDVGDWLMPATQRALVLWARRIGHPTVDIDPEHTTQLCHVCGAEGGVRDRLRCPTAEYPVVEVCRDRSAAATIAWRGAEADGQ